MTREYPPNVYGGAGVHVDHLSRELSRLVPVSVLCFDAQETPGDGRVWEEVTTDHHPLSVKRVKPWIGLAGPEQYRAALRTISVDLAMVPDAEGAMVVHSHTWYANLAGHLAKLVHGVPHVMTTHSLEPLRPWKAEQLGTGGYTISSFC